MAVNKRDFRQVLGAAAVAGLPLARHAEADAATAQSAINRALSMAPTDASILFEAGHVAHFTGDDVGARDYWQRALERDPHGPIGKAAREALNLLPAPLTVKTEPAPPK